MEQKAKGFYFLLAFLLTNSFRYWDKKGTEVTFKKQQGAKHKKEKVCYFKEYRGKINVEITKITLHENTRSE